MSQIVPLINPDVSQPIRVLFIGNSDTFWNEGLETHLRMLAASTDPPIAVEGASVVAPEAMLWELWDESKAVEQIRHGDWDVVFLQNAGSSNVDRYQTALAQFAEEARNVGAVPVLFAQWDKFNDPQSLNSQRCAAELDMPMAETGAAWSATIVERPDLALVDPNDPYGHASVPGTYLNTAVIYATVFGRSPEGLPYRPVDLLPDLDSVKPALKPDIERIYEQWKISEEDIAFLQRVAWETVLENQ